MAREKTANLPVINACKACCLVLLACIASTTPAQQVLQPTDLVAAAAAEEVRRYSVELIIFEYNGNDAGTELFLPDPVPESEVPENGEIPVFSDATGNPDSLAAMPPDLAGEEEEEPVDMPDDPDTVPELSAEDMILGEIPGPAQIHLQIMDPADYTLTEAYEKLAELGAYTPLLHAGWTQDAVEEDETRLIRLRRLGDPPLRLDGEVSLYLSRYLHLVVDLELEDSVAIARQSVAFDGDPLDPSRDTTPAPPQEPANNQYDPYVLPSFAPVHYRILEDRIVRNGELRYYDHPKFGVLAKIARIEEAAALPEEFGSGSDSIAGGNSQLDF